MVRRRHSEGGTRHTRGQAGACDAVLALLARLMLVEAGLVQGKRDLREQNECAGEGRGRLNPDCSCVYAHIFLYQMAPPGQNALLPVAPNG